VGFLRTKGRFFFYNFCALTCNRLICFVFMLERFNRRKLLMDLPL